MKVWKLVVNQKVSLEAAEAALTAACTEITQEQHPEGAYGMLDMVDMREMKTIIFISGNERTATVFSEMIEERIPKTRVILSSVPPSEIKKLMNQWFKSHTLKTQLVGRVQNVNCGSFGDNISIGQLDMTLLHDPPQLAENPEQEPETLPIITSGQLAFALQKRFRNQPRLLRWK